MSERHASCSCGQLRVSVEGDPVRVGAFADPSFPRPEVSVWEERKHHWVTMPPGIEIAF